MNERRKMERSAFVSEARGVSVPHWFLPRNLISACTRALLRCHPLSIIKRDKSHSGGVSANMLDCITVMLLCGGGSRVCDTNTPVTSLPGQLNKSYWSMNRWGVNTKQRRLIQAGTSTDNRPTKWGWVWSWLIDPNPASTTNLNTF